MESQVFLSKQLISSDLKFNDFCCCEMAAKTGKKNKVEGYCITPSDNYSSGGN
jgi:hypothetical protein